MAADDLALQGNQGISNHDIDIVATESSCFSILSVNTVTAYCNPKADIE